MKKRILLISIIALMVNLTVCANDQDKTPHKESNMNSNTHKLVIAHRGASGYLPEHSLAAKAMAYAMGADYIEQDVVMTKDNHLVVLHDPFLDRVTDVMEAFPNRSRQILGEKRWLAIDFTLQEIKTLRMTEGFSIDEKTGKKVVGYADRFPLFKSSFHVSTLEEEIELIQGLNKSTGKNIGIYVEIKAPWLHLLENKDISLLTLQTVKNYGYLSQQDKIYIQCFDPDETKRIKQELMPKLNIELKLVQLIAETSWNETMRSVDGKLVPYNYDWMFEAGGIEKIATYADGIGPWKPMLVTADSSKNNIHPSAMLKRAKGAKLEIHPYTFRREADRIPDYATSFENLLDIFLYQLDVDGVFTDFPDLAVKFIAKKEALIKKNH